MWSPSLVLIPRMIARSLTSLATFGRCSPTRMPGTLGLDRLERGRRWRGRASGRRCRSGSARPTSRAGCTPCDGEGHRRHARRASRASPRPRQPKAPTVARRSICRRVRRGIDDGERSIVRLLLGPRGLPGLGGTYGRIGVAGFTRRNQWLALRNSRLRSGQALPYGTHRRDRTAIGLMIDAEFGVPLSKAQNAIGQGLDLVEPRPVRRAMYRLAQGEFVEPGAARSRRPGKGLRHGPPCRGTGPRRSHPMMSPVSGRVASFTIRTRS